MKKSKHGMTSKQASYVKKIGHKREVNFNAQFGIEGYKINFSGSSADNIISKESYVDPILRDKFNISDPSLLDVSLKSGNTIQFHLGNIPELTDRTLMEIVSTDNLPTKVSHGIPFEEQRTNLKDKKFWNKYLKKGKILCYVEDEDHYTFFCMNSIIEFVIDKCTWRKLPTGRLKGNFIYRGKSLQILTYEYRSDKKQFVLGAHGSKKGKAFVNLLKENIKFHSEKKYKIS